MEGEDIVSSAWRHAAACIKRDSLTTYLKVKFDGKLHCCLKTFLIDGEILRALSTKLKSEYFSGQSNQLGMVTKIKMRQSAAKLLEQEKVQRLERELVDPKRDRNGRPLTGEDIVCSVQKCTAGVITHRDSVASYLDKSALTSRRMK